MKTLSVQRADEEGCLKRKGGFPEIGGAAFVYVHHRCTYKTYAFQRRMKTPILNWSKARIHIKGA